MLLSRINIMVLPSSNVSQKMKLLKPHLGLLGHNPRGVIPNDLPMSNPSDPLSTTPHSNGFIVTCLVQMVSSPCSFCINTALATTPNSGGDNCGICHYRAQRLLFHRTYIQHNRLPSKILNKIEVKVE